MIRSVVVIVWLGIGCASTHTPRDYSTSEVVAAASLLGVTALGATVARAVRPTRPPRPTRDTPTTPTTTRAERLTVLATMRSRCGEGDTEACWDRRQRLAHLAARARVSSLPQPTAALELIERRDTTVTARFVKGLEVYPGWLGTLSVSYRLPGSLQGMISVLLAEVRIDDIVLTDDGELIRFALDDEHPFALEDVDPWKPGGHLVFMLPQ